MAGILAHAFRAADAGFLARLGAAEQDQQARARDELYQYTRRLWDHVKARARDEHGPDWDITAGDPAASAVVGM
jgi:hypothetical protein